MAERKLLVEIFGEAKEFTAAVGEAEGSLHRIGTAAKVAGLALVGGLAYGIGKSVEAALEGQASHAKLDAALQATGQSVKDMTPALEAAQESTRKLGFTDDEARGALAK